MAFFEFLGPAVANRNYWGERERERRRHHHRKLDPLNQFFLTLMKLKLDLRSLDLAVRFGISESLVSRYITTWVCFLYQHLKEIEWMSAVEQVASTQPHAFREKYPTTFAIIDGSEIFIETPSYLQIQSSTWSNYKHHNTAKFLIACTPNGAICYISPLYVGSISDVELTRVSGFIQKLLLVHASVGYGCDDCMGISPPKICTAGHLKDRIHHHLGRHQERGVTWKPTLHTVSSLRPLSP